VTSLSAWLHVVAGWAGLDELRASIERLPDRLAAATELDWGAALKTLCEARSLVSIGRGPTLAIGRLEIEGDLQPPCRSIQRR
jgi:glutamine---fructose-6-phosphate transaminase (isomerizing)